MEKKNVQNKGYFISCRSLRNIKKGVGRECQYTCFFFFFLQFQSYECKLVKQSLKNKLKIMFEAGVFYYLVDFDDAHLITKLLAETFTGPVTTQAGIPG